MTSPNESSGHFRDRLVILGVTGSIAAYKAADLASKLHQAGATVRVVLTDSAAKFVTPLTFRAVTHQPVATGLWSDDESGVAHVELADRADLLLVAPASANTLAQCAHGLAPDFLSSLYLVTRAPVLFAPAMNGHMWTHPATQANVATLRARGHHFVEPDTGRLACGYVGAGRLATTEQIMAAATALLARTAIRRPLTSNP
jgi:phosphopantothenoylcysteine synthetase/decarboxylase